MPRAIVAQWPRLRLRLPRPVRHFAARAAPARDLRKNDLMSARAPALIAAVLCAAASLGAQSTVELLPTPSGLDSGMYSLATAANGQTYLVWIEPVAAGGHALKFSRFDGAGWQGATEIARGSNWFVNWADHPSLTAGPDGRLFVHWLVNTGQKVGSYGYAIRVATSVDQGRTWATAFEEGARNVHDYSGFLSFLPTARGIDAVYLTPLAPDDGASVAHDHIKTVGVASFGPDGTLVSRQILDGDACSCCSTDMAETSAGPVAVYRDHDAGDIRDISIVRRVAAKWTSPAPVHRDGWVIAGCPTNGPAVAASGSLVAVSWFTAAGGTPQVKIAFSTDAGATFAAPARVDGGTPTGWADVLLLDDGRALVSWLERTGEGAGDIRMRVVTREGMASVPVTVASASSGRATGIPMMARAGDHVIVAWRHGQVRTARIPIPAVAVSR